MFLSVTGLETMFADLGHFGAGPIRLAWLCIVFPSVTMNYLGQVFLINKIFIVHIKKIGCIAYIESFLLY